MLKNRFKNLIHIVFSSLALIAASYLGTVNAKGVYDLFNKPPFSPNPVFFCRVWPVIYILLILATVIIDVKPLSGIYKKDAVGTFWLQFYLSAAWPYFFFTLKLFLVGFIWLSLLIFFAYLTMIRYFNLSLTAGILIIPYITWLVFLAYLNLFICILN